MSTLPVIEDDEPVLSKRLVRYGLIWGVWTLVALFFSSQAYMMASERQEVRYAREFLFQAIACYLWALATPLVLWLSRRYRIERNNWKRRAGLHFLFSLALVSTLLLIHPVIFMGFLGRLGNLTSFRLFVGIYYNLDRWLLIYWFILLMSHAFNYYNSCRR